MAEYDDDRYRKRLAESMSRVPTAEQQAVSAPLIDPVDLVTGGIARKPIVAGARKTWGLMPKTLDEVEGVAQHYIGKPVGLALDNVEGVAQHYVGNPVGRALDSVEGVAQHYIGDPIEKAIGNVGGRAQWFLEQLRKKGR